MQKEALGNAYNSEGGKSGFLRRLAYDKPSPTLLTLPNMPATDLAHPTEDRPLSIEEYACIQEFPKNFKLCGDLTEQYRQLGNAVPLKLGEAVAKTILNDRQGLHYTSDFVYTRYKNSNDVTWTAMMKQQFKEYNERRHS
jgi:DNA (cytosine-5)-methyltransferase 1